MADAYNVTQLVAPTWLNNGDNAWQLTSATFVGLQSIPGLLILYAGLMKRKWTYNTAFLVFYTFALVLICWVIWVYKMSFGDQWIPIAGIPGPALGIDWQLGQAVLPTAGISTAFPMATMVWFQFVFCAITLILILGGCLGRVTFTAWTIFVPVWMTLSYSIGAFSIWGGGFLAQLGVLDYSGGYVIHLSSGTAAYVAALIIGPRHPDDRRDNRPSNPVAALIGAGLLWLGWSGFNGGDPYTASPDAGVAVINTHTCAAMSLLTWTALDIFYYKKPSIQGSINGMITGLVAITPAAGFIPGWASIVMGAFSGSIPWLTMNIPGKRFPLNYVDDTLGIFHTHCIGGLLGGFLTGIFATAEGVVSFGTIADGGAISGNGRQVWVQLVGGLFVVGWNTVVTAIIETQLLATRFILRVPLRYSDEILVLGDVALHSDAPYSYDTSAPGYQVSDTHHDHIFRRGAIVDHNVDHDVDVESGSGESPQGTQPKTEKSFVNTSVRDAPEERTHQD